MFGSWHNDRAITYRKINNIPGDWGTAVTVQSMVFGNLGDDCATGVAFTRNPSNGEKGIYGEYLVNAQGEDVVAGIPRHIPSVKKAGLAKAAREGMSGRGAAREVVDPRRKFSEGLRRAAQDFQNARNHFKDCQDMEFTIEREQALMLQTRNGKRTAESAVRIAVDMADESSSTSALR